LTIALLAADYCFVMDQSARGTDKDRPSEIEESDRAARLLYIQRLANETFGSQVKAERWLLRPLVALSGEAPLVIAQTEAGARVVETILGKIRWGAAA
jgi:putative toxin-antitoxin system antitoxin component (TIGR02293 family)